MGIIGERSITASAASISFSEASVSSRSPNGRLPIWSWFCRKLTKVEGGSFPLGSPRGLLPQKVEVSP